MIDPLQIIADSGHEVESSGISGIILVDGNRLTANQIACMAEDIYLRKAWVEKDLARRTPRHDVTTPTKRALP